MPLHRIIFMGTPSFSVPTLEALKKEFSSAEITVVTRPDVPRGRGQQVLPSEVKVAAQKLNLRVESPSTKDAVAALVANIRPDIVVVIAYGMILPSTVVEPYFCLNVHGSVLPKYRGPSPIHAALLAGDAKTGISLIRLNDKMDAGEIFAEEETPILPEDNRGTLESKLSNLGAQMTVDFLKNEFITGKREGKKQIEDLATYCKKIKKEDLLLEPTLSPREIYNRIRAFSPQPGAYCLAHGKRVKILAADLHGEHLEIKTVQPEGKAPMSYHDYCLGNPSGLAVAHAQ